MNVSFNNYEGLKLHEQHLSALQKLGGVYEGTFVPKVVMFVWILTGIFVYYEFAVVAVIAVISNKTMRKFSLDFDAFYYCYQTFHILKFKE